MRQVMKVASVSDLRSIEAAADRAFISYDQMMQNAGEAAGRILQERCQINAATNVAFLIGKGNNGGDGLVMALDLATSTGAKVSLYLLEARAPADKNYQAVLNDDFAVTLASDDEEGEQLKALIASADIIVDALFGIGARLPLKGAAAKALAQVKACLSRNVKRSARPFILALDCPSGVDCDTGAADENALTADATITFIAGKPGLFTFPAAEYVGDLVIATIGIPPQLPALEQIAAAVVDAPLASSLLPDRRPDGHKGTYGKVMVVAGSPNYIGAIALAGEAAYRSGAGLVTIAAPRRMTEIAAANLREPTWLPLPERDGAIAEEAAEAVAGAAKGYDALLVGCGLGAHETTSRFVHGLLASDSLPPLVIDADGLNALRGKPQWWTELPPGSIITPHPGEMARLIGRSAKAINADRWHIARHYAELWNLLLVLKGAHTLVAAPDGRIGVIPFKTDALSTAGAGDVLAGLIAGLRGGGLGAFECACLGAYVHASAGIIATEAAGSSRSVIAGDVLSALGKAFAALEAL